MAPVGVPRSLRTALAGVSLLALLAGCEAGQMGFGGQVPAGEFAVLTASPERAVLSAQGQRVAVEPASGFCVAEDSIETSDRSAFVLIGDCALASDGIDLSSGMPGITTVSISGDPGFSSGGASAADLSALERYLAQPEGRALLGRGGDGAEVSIIETRREGDTLFVLVEDQAAQPVPLLATRFWRGFVELNGRLTVVTVSGFVDAPMDEGQMLRHLGAQVRQLQLANAVPVEEAPIQVAQATQLARARPAEARSGKASSVARANLAEAPSTTRTPLARPASKAADAAEAPVIADPGQETPRAAWGSIPDWPPADEADRGEDVADRPAAIAAIPSPAASRTPSTMGPVRSEPVVEPLDRGAAVPDRPAAAPTSNQPRPISRPGNDWAAATAENERAGGAPAPKPAPRLSDSAREVVGGALAGSSAPLPPARAKR